MYKILYFNSGDGEDTIDESVAYPISALRGFTPRSATVLSLYFTPIKDTTQDTTADLNDQVDLTITSGAHRTIIKAITDEIAFGDQAFITVGNKDDEVWLHSGITDVILIISS
ncbi:MAG: hypothetical protein CMH62_00515 [Nanoarchaeota archaeon]|jgi:hypothetical protein|nr:hypothetical protein [Nanoarchaeota archaeon]|tara:strand:- start:3301 stop:3639 length:339 start_codon:yes stop_codon:yes gene_type:complete